jgi:hypothetical protein
VALQPKEIPTLASDYARACMELLVSWASLYASRDPLRAASAFGPSLLRVSDCAPPCGRTQHEERAIGEC